MLYIFSILKFIIKTLIKILERDNITIKQVTHNLSKSIREVREMPSGLILSEGKIPIYTF